MGEGDSSWATWLARKLDERGWRQADLVSQSEGHIKRDRVSKWIRGVETPTHRLAIVTANTLGVAREEALYAAGFETREPQRSPLADLAHELQAAPHARRLEVLLSDVSDSALLGELRRRAIEREESSSEDKQDGVSAQADSVPNLTGEDLIDHIETPDVDSLRLAAKHGETKAERTDWAE